MQEAAESTALPEGPLQLSHPCVHPDPPAAPRPLAAPLPAGPQRCSEPQQGESPVQAPTRQHPQPARPCPERGGEPPEPSSRGFGAGAPWLRDGMRAVGAVRELALFLGTLLYAYAEAAVRLLLPARRKAVGGELVLLTGASRGLGRATAREFARRQSRLVLWDVDTVTGCRAPLPVLPSTCGVRGT